ncbi:hypothetical protein BST81_04495 [Leptolyngbya sp. 'hensonii']|uniref:CHAT domain-containing protein n=1 Tax=Leptolyngbya sp. 'hensonii' TaxID=1922337 RepID=UPI00094FF0C8|nr:CHAT domain-containing protein [Leptolyngbya sp. 'hensonii']OLP19535.1 hypothetical protein BST81_04495 [Leptolyngbya sp. 'hensonii']
MKFIQPLCRALPLLLWLTVASLAPARSQSIIPASDGTQTIVTPNGNILNISGGQLSGDGANLFHSFTQFGLSSQQIANFLSIPGIQNILARVVGGDPSVINGLIQVTGSNANLYLMNPAGIVFGPTASLNVPAAFTATTANRIGFSNGGQFNTVGPNSYATLTGLPQDFTFTALQPGAIVNAGQLTVGQGQAVTLLGGVVINTGTIAAPGGQITIAAVPGQKLVRVSQSGSLLSLDLPVGSGQTGSSPIQPLNLPALLTSPGVTGATGVVVENGEVKLTSANTVIPTNPGTAIVSGTLTTASSTAVSEIKVLGSRVGLFAATLNASGPSGGTILVGGDYQGQGTVPNAQITYVSPDSVIQADAIGQGNGGKVVVWADQSTVFQGNISVQGGKTGGNGGVVEVSGKQNLGFTGQVNTAAPQGQTGTLLLDPDNVQVISSAGPQDIQFFTSGGKILAGDAPATFVISSTALSAFLGTIIVQATNDISFDPGITVNFTSMGFFPDITFTADADNNGVGTFTLPASSSLNTNGRSILISGAQLNALGPITTNANFTDSGNVNLSAQGTLVTGLINASSNFNGGNVTLSSATGAIQISSISTVSFSVVGENSGSVSVTAQGPITSGAIITNSSGAQAGDVTLVSTLGNIEVTFINTESPSDGQGGNVTITTPSFFKATGTFTASNGLTASISTIGFTSNGTITITHGGNGLLPFTIGDASQNGTAGVITNGTDTLSIGESFPLSTTRGTIRLITGSISEFYQERRGGLPSMEEGKLEIKPACGLSGAGSSFTALEQQFTAAYERYLGGGGSGSGSADSACAALSSVAEATGVKPALIYVSFVPMGDITKTTGKRLSGSETVLWQFTDQGLGAVAQAQTGQKKPQDSDQLVLVLVTPSGLSQQRLPVSRVKVLQMARQLRASASNPNDEGYLAPGQQLYQWLVAPLEPVLKQQKIGNLVFLMDTGLRTLPIAALHDGKGFIVEKYSVGLMPSISLTDTRRVSIQNARVLAMGASTFRDQTALPAVPVELETITQRLRSGKAFLNQNFTVSQLKIQRRQDPVTILHLATHGEFRAGSAANSYIQFWDRKLGLDEIRQLGLNNPIVELLVLSACRTAVGSDEAELGFGGLAVQAGVKTVLASLWYVSDEGTLGLMTQFYESLNTAPMKAEALRQAQVAMLQGKIRLEPGTIIVPGRIGSVPLPPALQGSEGRSLTHPYYWAAFTMIGNPW